MSRGAAVVASQIPYPAIPPRARMSQDEQGKMREREGAPKRARGFPLGGVHQMPPAIEFQIRNSDPSI